MMKNQCHKKYENFSISRLIHQFYEFVYQMLRSKINFVRNPLTDLDGTEEAGQSLKNRDLFPLQLGHEKRTHFHTHYDGFVRALYYIIRKLK